MITLLKIIAAILLMIIILIYSILLVCLLVSNVMVWNVEFVTGHISWYWPLALNIISVVVLWYCEDLFCTLFEIFKDGFRD